MDGSIAVWKRKAAVNTVSLVVVLGPARVCGKVGARNFDWFSWPARKLHQSANESQTAAHVMQSRGNTACGRMEKRDRPWNDAHAMYTALHGNNSIM